MKRTQLQVPEPLYREVRRIARLNDWSVSEVFRRAVELLVAQFPTAKDGSTSWKLPHPRNLGAPKVDPSRWRGVLEQDETGDH
jgi:hypothetical protein